MKKSTLTYLFCVFLTCVAIISRFYLADTLSINTNNLNFKNNIFSVDNLYDLKTERFKGDVFSNSTYAFEVQKAENDTIDLKVSFSVYQNDSNYLFHKEENYLIQSDNLTHLNKGTPDAPCYLFAPPNFNTKDFCYYHINYDDPLTMKYQETVYISGVKAYRFQSLFETDQTIHLTHLEGVPEKHGINLDVRLNIWVDPLTGWLIKYEDFAEAWYYDKSTGLRIYPWNKFHNESKESSIQNAISFIKTANLKYELLSAYLPIVLLFIILFTLIRKYLKTYKESNQLKPFLISFFILIICLGTSSLIYDYLVNKKIESANLKFESLAMEGVLAIKNEFSTNYQVLENIKNYLISKDTLSYNEFNNLSYFWLLKHDGIESINWAPYVRNEQRFIYENAWKEKGYDNFSFTMQNQKKEIIPRQTKEAYYPIHFTVPEKKGRFPLGFDLLSDSVFESMINKTVATRTNISKYEKSDKHSFLTFLPVSNKSIHKGVIIGSFNLKNIVNYALKIRQINEKHEFIIKDVTEVTPVELYNNSNGNKEMISINKTIPILDKIWSIKVCTSEQESNMAENIILFVTIAFSFLIAFFIYFILKDNSDEVQLQYDEIIKKNELLNNQTRLLQKQNEELEQFAYITSHDLQEPLKNIIGFVDRINANDQNNLNPKQKVFFEYVKDSTKRMTRMIEGLLEYSRVGKNRKIEKVNLDHCLNTVLSDLEYLVRNTNTIIKHTELPIVSGFEMELRLLLQNLISNAIKYRKKDLIPRIIITCTEDADYWKFSINDNGIGIKDNNLGKVFQLFKRLHTMQDYNGTGIGLAHCKKIVELHQGQIWVESQNNEGSTFHFTLKKEL